MKEYFKFIKFSIIGSFNTIISLLIYYFLLYINSNYIVATILAYVCSSILGYFLSKNWVFDNRNKNFKKSIIKYYVLYGSSILLNILILYILVDLLSISKIIAPLIVLIVIIPYNFFISKNWVFRNG